MAVSGGFGVVWEITVTSTLTTVANMEEITFPSIETEEVEITAHDSVNGYQEYVATGRKLTDTFTATLTWDVSEATNAELVTLQGSGDSNAMTLATPGATETMAFNGIVKKISRESASDGALQAEVEIRVNGAITIT